MRHRPAHTEEAPIDPIDTTRRLLTAYADARTPLDRTRVFAVAVRWARSLDTADRQQLADDIRTQLDGRTGHLRDLPDADRLATITTVADARKALGSVSPKTLRTVADLLGAPPSDTTKADVAPAAPTAVGAARPITAQRTTVADTPAEVHASVPTPRRHVRRRLPRPGGLLAAAARAISRRALAAAHR